MTRKTMQPRLALAVGTLALAMVAWGCASTGATPRPFPTPGPRGSGGSKGGVGGAEGASESEGPRESEASRVSEGSEGARDSRGLVSNYALVGTALSFRGVPYRNGGSDPQGFDCSGFTQYVFAQHGLALPRDVRDQFQFGKLLRGNDLEPGDLLFFSTTAPGASHVGIAIGGDQFVHAPSSTGVVRVEHLTASYWSRRFVGARRLQE